MFRIFIKLVINGEKVFFIRMSYESNGTEFSVKYKFTRIDEAGEKKFTDTRHQIKNAVDILNTILSDFKRLYDIGPMLNIGIGYKDKFFYYVVNDLYKPQAFNFCGQVMTTMIEERNSPLSV